MDNKAIANILYETADLLEIDGQDSFRIRSYRNAAQAIENHSQQIKELIADPKQVLAIPGIGKSMLRNLQELLTEGKLSIQSELLEKYNPSMLQLLKIQGLGPKTIALIWSAHKVSDVDGVEKLAREGKIRELPRMGEKHEAKLLKAIEDYRRISGRFLIDAGETEAAPIDRPAVLRHADDEAGRVASVHGGEQVVERGHAGLDVGLRRGGDWFTHAFLLGVSGAADCSGSTLWRMPAVLMNTCASTSSSGPRGVQMHSNRQRSGVAFR